MNKQTIKNTIRKFRVSPQYLAKVRALCLKYKIRIIAGSLIFAAIAVSLVMAWPRTIVFSYGRPSCITQPLLAPALHEAIGSDDFTLTATDGWSIGSVRLTATKVCITPTKAPKEGEQRVTLSPFGISWLGKPLVIKVAAAPVASLGALERPVPVSKPLRIALSGEDRVFSYRLRIGGKSTPCPLEGQLLVCDVPKLALAQGAVYQVELVRQFAAQQPKVLAKREIRTLTAVVISATSIKPQEVVFAKPKAVQIEFDKSVATVEATLIHIDGEKRDKIPTNHTQTDKKIEFTWSDDLPRRSGYELRVDKVLASDGSTLVEPFVLPFTTSGGPKVTNVNIGRFKVSQGVTAILTFDQPLSETQDITKALSGTNGAVVTGKRGNQAFIGLAGVPKCGGFTLSVGDALASNYEVSGGSAWSYSSRIQCYSVGSIGASAKGRPITAYYFGDGPTAAIYTGAIHGSESSTRSLMLRWIDDLEANPGNIPAGKSVVVVPTINPDGIALGQRTNANNVDLNRNFGTSDWRKDITTINNAPFPGGGGSEPMSEPETRAIAGLVAQRRPQLVLSYHSIGGVVISNQSGNANARAATYVSQSGYGNATGQTSTTFDYSISGTADDYYAEKLGVPSLVIELGSHTYHQFERNQRAMWAMLK